MVTIKRIDRQNDIVTALYYPENSGENGVVTVDLSAKEIVKSGSTIVPGYSEIYQYKAGRRLIQYFEDADKDEIPAQLVCVWY